MELSEMSLKDQSIIKKGLAILEMFINDFQHFEKGKEMAIIYVNRLILSTLPDDHYSSHEYWKEVKEVVLSAKQ